MHRYLGSGCQILLQHLERLRVRCLQCAINVEARLLNQENSSTLPVTASAHLRLRMVLEPVRMYTLIQLAELSFQSWSGGASRAAVMTRGALRSCMAQQSFGPLPPDAAGWRCWKPPQRMRDTVRLLNWLSICAGVAITTTVVTAVLGDHSGDSCCAGCPEFPDFRRGDHWLCT